MYMLWDLVNLFLGGLPQEYNFLKIYGIILILYVFIKLFKMFIDVLMSLMRWF